VANQRLRILNLDIGQQSERYEMDHLIGNKYVAQHHSEALATMEVKNEEKLSKVWAVNSVHKSKVQSDDVY